MRPQAHLRLLRLVWAALLVLAVSWSTPMAAQPALRVRAATHVELMLAALPTGVRVSGVLRDDMDTPVADREVRVAVAPSEVSTQGEAQLVQTGADGRFSCTFTTSASTYRARASYEGDTFYERSETTQRLDRSAAGVQLVLALPPDRVLHLDAPTVHIATQASSTASVAALRLSLHDELGRELASGRTDEDGLWQTELASTLLGEPGVGTLVVSSLADPEHAAGTARATVLRQLHTRLTLQASTRATPPQLLISGRLAHARGGLPQRAVAVLVDETPVATLLTDARGELRRALDWSELGVAELPSHVVSAVFESDSPGIGSSRSARVALTAPNAPLPSRAWLLFACAASLVLAWRARAASLGTQPDGAVGAAASARRAMPRRRVSTPRIAGTVEDAERATPLPSARVELHDGIRLQRNVAVSAEGAFDTREIASGTYQIVVSAAGYAAERVAVVVPHAGDGSRLRVRLTTLRSLALQTYRPIAVRILHEPGLCSMRTPRDVLALARERAYLTDELQTLTGLVERAAYAQREPTPEEISAIREAARVALQTLGPEPSASHIPKR